MSSLAREPISIGISTCPNDTFAFAALLEKRVPAPDFRFQLQDVEALNEALLRRELQVSKCSFHAALQLADDYIVLPVGAALGFGVGPLLLAAPHIFEGRSPQKGDRVLCPGRWTTASLLFKMFFPDVSEPEQTIFSEIMPTLIEGKADYGVVIHEGRFTYQERGLHLSADLGALWEKDTKGPLPLGGIVALKSLGAELLAEISTAIRSSLEDAKQFPERALPQMRKHAREFEENVLWEHIELYVNEQTEDLGPTGVKALQMLQKKYNALGLSDAGALSIYTQPG